MERLVIRHFYARPPEDQLLVTFGLAIVFVEAVRFHFSSQSQMVPAPKIFAGITNMGFMLYPTYRLAVVGICAIALVVLFLVLYRTRLGMIVRAGIEDSVMVDSLGINVHAAQAFTRKRAYPANHSPDHGSALFSVSQGGRGPAETDLPARVERA
jgi:branched-chain amino acid transport system permease protein